MNKKSTYLLFALFTTITILIVVVTYLYINKTLTKEQIKEKNILVSTLGLPDLSLLNSSIYLRHRSLSNIFSIFNEGPELKEHQMLTFTYSHSNILNNTPSKILNEK